MNRDPNTGLVPIEINFKMDATTTTFPLLYLIAETEDTSLTVIDHLTKVYTVTTTMCDVHP